MQGAGAPCCVGRPQKRCKPLVCKIGISLLPIGISLFIIGISLQDCRDFPFIILPIMCIFAVEIEDKRCEGSPFNVGL